MKKLKYLLFLLPFCFSLNVFALDYDVTNSITSPVAPSGSGTYTGIENNGATSSWNVKTRYQGLLQGIRYNIPLPSNWPDGDCYAINNTYTITMNMATNDWRNRFGTVRVVPYSSYSGNWSNGKVTFVNMKTIKFSFTIPSSYDSCADFVYVDLPSSSLFTPFTGETNWNLSKVTLTDPMYTSGGSSGGGSSGGGSTSSNQDIINNNTENTTNIINNNNNNTQDIIDNNNNNTQQIIDNQQELLGNCITNVMTGSDIISLDNLYSSGNNFQQITADTNTTLLLSLQAYNNGSYLYNLGDIQYITTTKTYTIRFTKTADYNAIKFKLNGRVRDTGLMINVSSLKDDHIYYISADFFRITQGDIRFNRLIIKENSSSGFAPWGETVCVSKLDSTTDAINDVNNSINNSSVESGTGQGFFDNFTSQDFGLSQIITIPLNTIQSLTSKSCVPLQVPIPFTNSNISLPCMTEIYETKFPSIYNLWKITSFGIVAYLIAIDIFHIVKGFKDPESDKVEVLDL